jgi:putative membrane protein
MTDTVNTTTNHDDHIMKDLSKPKTPMEYIRLFFSGFAMGSADIVPGVSGGTMAFILGVYETLIDAIKSFNLDAIRLAIGFKLGELFEHIPIRFLIALGLGILSAILLLASLLEGWLETQPTLVFAFFGGLIIASIIAVGAKVTWSPSAWVALVVGTIVAFVIVGLPSLGDQLGHGAPILFVSGMIAICAMILPGISGSFILLILGQYDFILGAVKDRDIMSLIAVAVGAVIGLLAFSRVLSWLLKHYESPTIAALVGFMIGSLRLIVHRAQYAMVEENGIEIEQALTISSETLIFAVLLAIAGFVLVTVIDHAQSRSNPLLRLVWR